MPWTLGASETRFISSFPFFSGNGVEAAWCSARVRFLELVLLAGHELGRRSPAEAGKPGESGCLGKFHTSPTCSCCRGKTGWPREAPCHPAAESLCVHTLSLCRNVSSLAMQILCAICLLSFYTKMLEVDQMVLHLAFCDFPLTLVWTILKGSFFPHKLDKCTMIFLIRDFLPRVHCTSRLHGTFSQVFSLHL